MTSNPQDHLDSLFFAQEFSPSDGTLGRKLGNAAASYAFTECGIAVLSDLREKHSLIFYGPLGDTLGIAPCGQVHRVDSIWEEELLSRIPAGHLEKKQLEELLLVDYVRRHGPRWILDSTLPLRDDKGEDKPVRHRIQYFTDGSSIRYALCLYTPSSTYEGPFLRDLLSGQCIPLETVGAGGILSPREIEVLRLVDEGASSKIIASTLGISIHTVSRHRQNILSKLRASNCTQALRMAKGLHLM